MQSARRCLDKRTGAGKIGSPATLSMRETGGRNPGVPAVSLKTRGRLWISSSANRPKFIPIRRR